MLGRSTTLVKFLEVLQKDLLSHLMLMVLKQLNQLGLQMFLELQQGKCIVNHLANLARSFGSVKSGFFNYTHFMYFVVVIFYLDN